MTSAQCRSEYIINSTWRKLFYLLTNTNYIISSVMHTFWLVLTYDLLEGRCIDDIIIKTFFNSLLYKTNRFQVAVHLFSNRSQRTSKCSTNISDTLGCTSCATFLFLPHFDIIGDLLLNRCMATWNLFIKLITVPNYFHSRPTWHIVFSWHLLLSQDQFE